MLFNMLFIYVMCVLQNITNHGTYYWKQETFAYILNI